MAIRAIYTEIMQDGRPRFGLSPSDMEKVSTGYGCPNCLEDFNGIYQVKCPLCGHVRDLERDLVETPGYWKPDPNSYQ